MTKALAVRSFFLLLIISSAVYSAHAQSIPPVGPVMDPRQAGANPSSERKPAAGSPEEELTAKRELRLLEKSHTETVERSHEAARLGSQVRDAYQVSKSLGRAELKKLERLEKVARHIRNDSGGSDGESALANIPHDVARAVTRLAEVSEEIQKTVEKTPRQVVSASVIEKANELLDIVRFLRQN